MRISRDIFEFDWFKFRFLVKFFDKIKYELKIFYKIKNYN